MAARVKQHNAARRQLLEGGEHSGEIHPRVALSKRDRYVPQSRRRQRWQRGSPGWIADPDRGVGEVALEEIERPPLARRSPQCLDGGDASGTQRRMIVAKQQGLDRAAMRRQPLHRQIKAGLLLLTLQPVSGLTDRLQLGNNGLLVIVQPDAEVNFVCPGDPVERLPSATG